LLRTIVSGNLQQRARFVEFQTGTTREKLRRIAIAKIAQKVRLHAARGEKLLLAAFAFQAL
jgi:hypothetical protein